MSFTDCASIKAKLASRCASLGSDLKRFDGRDEGQSKEIAQRIRGINLVAEAYQRGDCGDLFDIDQCRRAHEEFNRCGRPCDCCIL
mmetsp:Transcript_90154/g.254258  ORF Transcript_90154/g.254258 Transcript_90154/m.254258 type:complete len:86 (+) Transcript_90154:86-343(+)